MSPPPPLQGKPLLLLLGGMGPMAGVRLHEQLVTFETAARCDQEHLDVLHLSFAGSLPDRSSYLIRGDTQNPGLAAAELIKPYLQLADMQGRNYLVLIPCATFHSSPILEPFLLACGEGLRERFVSLIGPAVASAIQRSPGRRIGILATDGSVASGVWQTEIERMGATPITPDTPAQAQLQDAIFHASIGIKANPSPTDASVSAINQTIRNLVQQGVDAVILGCTDISLIVDRLQLGGLIHIDPLHELARHAIASLSDLQGRRPGGEPPQPARNALFRRREPAP